jgi:hypothetical protein
MTMGGRRSALQWVSTCCRRSIAARASGKARRGLSFDASGCIRLAAARLVVRDLVQENASEPGGGR